MKRSVGLLTAMLLAWLLTGCSSSNQPSGPPPLVGAPSATVAPAGPTPGTTVLTYHLRDSVTGLAWSPDGKRIATSSGKTIQIWDASTGIQLFTFGSPLASVASLAWSPDGRSIVASGGTFVGDDAGLRIWNATNGTALVAIATIGHTESIAAGFLVWSPDSSKIAGAVEIDSLLLSTNPRYFAPKYRVQIWDAASGKLLLTYSGHSDQVNALAWSSDGKEIASASSDQTVQVWEAATGTLRYTYRGHKQVVDVVAWSPDGQFLASGGGDNKVQVWEAAAGMLRYTYPGHTGEVIAVAWSPDGKRIVSASAGVTENHPVQVWDAFTGHHALYYQGLSGTITAAVWSPDGSRIATASGEVVTVWLAG